jgi:hypothetical protein
MAHGHARIHDLDASRFRFVLPVRSPLEKTASLEHTGFFLHIEIWRRLDHFGLAAFRIRKSRNSKFCLENSILPASDNAVRVSFGYFFRGLYNKTPPIFR